MRISSCQVDAFSSATSVRTHKYEVSGLGLTGEERRRTHPFGLVSCYDDELLQMPDVREDFAKFYDVHALEVDIELGDGHRGVG